MTMRRLPMGARISTLLINSVILVAFCVGTATADCRGCCSHHGGVVCRDGITQCADGTPLSATCRAKGCTRCADATPAPNQRQGKPSRQRPALSIANFNIQVFGIAKARKADVMETLAKTLSRFDVVAIQEIRDKSSEAIKALEERVDALGQDYTALTGPRLGRTASQEQYAYLYRTDTLECLGAYTYDDTARDQFHREPFIAHFRARHGAFSFVLITIHTDPDDATAEIRALSDVVADARVHFPDEPRIILLGDFNADCAYYDEEESVSDLRNDHYLWLITNDMDTNVAASECTYDRIVITSETAPYHAGKAQVFRFDEAFGLSPKEARAVSDHYPVYALFNTELPATCAQGLSPWAP